MKLKFEKYKVVFIGLLLVSLAANIFFIMETKNLEEKIGHEVGTFSDIALMTVPSEILKMLSQEGILHDGSFERIDGEFKVGIPFYILSNGIQEIENYFRYTERQFIEFKMAYKESDDKNTEEIKKLRKELVETCEKGVELYHKLNIYFDKHSGSNGAYDKRSNSKKMDRMWYQAYKDKENEIRKLIVETLGEERTKIVL